MKNWLAKHRNEVVVSIISSLIVTTFFKAGDIILAVAPHASGKLYELLNNKIYYFAANQSSVSLFGNTFLIIIIIFFTFSISFVISSTSTAHEYDITKALKEELEKGDEKNTQKLEKLKKQYAKISGKDNSLKSSKIITALLILFVIMTIWTTFFMYTYLFIPVKMWHDFQLDITQITPYCDNKEVERLQSDWVCMERKEDYEAIYNTIFTIRDTKGLPPLSH